MKRWISILLCGAVLLGLLSACQQEDQTEQQEGLTLRVSAVERQTSADPAAASATGASMVLHLYENLMKWEDDGTGHAVLTYGMAKSYEMESGSDGSVTYTFTLRGDTVWSDGEPVTADDFVYAWQRLFSLEEPPAALYRFSQVQGYDDALAAKDGTLLTGVVAQGDYTLIVRLTGPCTYFLDTVCAGAATMPVRRDLVENGSWGSVPAVTNGPYVLESLDSQEAVLKRSETYYTASGPMEIDFVWDTGDAEGNYEELTEGQLDFVSQLPEEELAQRKEAGELTIEPVAAVTTLLLNTAQASFSSADVRQAFALAVDQEAMLEAAGAVTETAATGFVPWGISNRDESWTQSQEEDGEDTVVKPEDLLKEEPAEAEETPEFWDYRAVGDAMTQGEEQTQEEQETQAKSLLAQAGYPGGAGFPEVEYLYVDSGVNAAVARYLTKQWKKVLGVTVTPVALSEEDLRTRLTSGDFALASFRYTTTYDDAGAFLSRWRSTISAGGGNVIAFSDRAYDLLLDTAAVTNSGTARDAVLHEAEGLLLSSYGVVPLYYDGTVSQLRQGLAGLVRTPLGAYLFTGVTEAA